MEVAGATLPMATAWPLRLTHAGKSSVIGALPPRAGTAPPLRMSAASSARRAIRQMREGDSRLGGARRRGWRRRRSARSLRRPLRRQTRADGGAVRRFYMAASVPRAFGEIAGERADIGAPRAGHLEARTPAWPCDAELGRVPTERHGGGARFDRLAGAARSQARSPSILDGGEDGRALEDGCRCRPGGPRMLSLRWPDVGGGDDLALGASGCGCRTCPSSKL